ncbi:hypothetical protein ACFVH6_32235 [Spirillospora sp. NPDC127200]
MEAQVLLGRQVTVQGRVLEDRADVAPHVVALAHHVVPGDAGARLHRTETLDQAVHLDDRSILRRGTPERRWSTVPR